MTEAEATALSHTIHESTALPASVEADGDYFSVVVRSGQGTFTLYDEADWPWLSARMGN
jgi:hypothetical protein